MTRYLSKNRITVNRFIFFMLLGFFGSTPILAQMWEVQPSPVIHTRESGTVLPDHIINQYLLHDFPYTLADGDFIQLPGPADQIISVQVKNSPVFDPVLQNRYPQIRSYSFHSETMNGRIAVDPEGVDVVFNTKNGRYAIEQVEGDRYALYSLSALASGTNYPVMELGKCLTPSSTEPPPLTQPHFSVRRAPAVKRRTYDLALSTTSTYATRHGGTTESILVEVNKIFNRVNEVFLRELALQFQILDKSTELFFLNEQTDPYTEGNNTLMLNKLDETLVSVVGRKNFDLGHLLATNCGSGTAGVSAGTGTICEFNKGKALSCDLTDNLEEYVRVLTHELGHQLGAAHTWSNCPPVNTSQRASGSAYEPGSGSSIMSYIGTCGNENLTFIPGPFYFHTGSIQQMLQYIEIGPGSTCVATEETANESPEIVSVNIPESNDLYIPISTPFFLKGDATDADGDQLTYAWDQLDVGPIAPLGEPIQSGPSIRSYAPSTSGTRYIPRLTALTRNMETPEEVLPTYGRDFTFGLTVRDNHPNGGGLAQEEVTFHSTTKAGPFFVDYPNDSTDQLFAGSLTRVQWNVADTDGGLVNAPYVTIKMSTDGGDTYPIVLAEQTENDGEQDVQLPNIVSDSVRFFIQGYDHIFFDISDQNIPVVNPDAPVFGLNLRPGRQIICLPQTAEVNVSAFPVLGFDEQIEYFVENPYPDVEVAISKNQSMVNEMINLTFDVPETFNSDTLLFKLNAISSLTDTISREISLIVVNNSHKELALQTPNDSLHGVEVVPSFDWAPSPNADYYTLQVSTSAGFNPEFLVISEPNITADSFPSSTILEEGQVYFWRVLPHNKCSVTTDVPVSAFQTKVQDCRIYTATDLPKGLGASSPGEIVSEVEVVEDFEVSDVNVLNLEGFHESVNQLKLFLQKDTTAVTLYEGECGIRSLSFDINYDDESVAYTDCRLGSGSRVKPLKPLSALEGKGSMGTWKLHWQDSTIGAGGVFQAWMLELCGAVNLDRLEVKTDTLFVAPGGQNPLTGDQLQIANGQGAIFEWIDSTRSGLLLKNGVPLQPGQKWTTDDLVTGVIQYKNVSDFDQEDITLSAEAPDGKWSGIVRVPVKLDAMVPVSKDILTSGITVYPNPADPYIVIKAKSHVAIQHIEVRDIHGKALYRYQSDSPFSDLTISSSTWPAGMVIVTITAQDQLYTRKVMIH